MNEIIEFLPDWLIEFTSMFNTTFIVTIAFIYVKVIQPKLNKHNWLDSNVSSLRKDYDELTKTFNTVYRDLKTLKQALSAMSSYSNLGDAPKAMIQNLLEDADIDEEDLTEETKKMLKQTQEAIDKEVANKKKTALQELSEEVESIEEG